MDGVLANTMLTEIIQNQRGILIFLNFVIREKSETQIFHCLKLQDLER